MPAGTSERPGLVVVSDTEEEFDWSGPFDRTATGTGHMRHVDRLQSICERHAIRPVYVVSHPIAANAVSADALRPIVQDGRALVGAHLHPWVTPPMEEEVNPANSFAGNLPPALEHAKLRALTERIADSFGIRPEIYKAGRYGLGPRSFAALESLGYTVDLSPSPPFDYRPDGGPDFSRRSLEPSWEGPGHSIFCIPGTAALIGRLPSRTLYRAASSRRLTPLRAVGILARLGLVERLRLSPEGHTTAELVRLANWLHTRGQRLFVLSLHSPSLEPGHSPYVRTNADLTRLLGTLNDTLTHLTQTLGAVPTDPLELRRRAGGKQGQGAALDPQAARRPLTRHLSSEGSGQ